MTIGERIKARRQELGLSVDEVAEKLKKNRATIYRYESSDIEKLPTTVLEPLSEILRVSPAYLMGWEDNTFQQVEDLDAEIESIINESSSLPFPDKAEPVRTVISKGTIKIAPRNTESDDKTKPTLEQVVSAVDELSTEQLLEVLRRTTEALQERQAHQEK